MNSLRFSKIWFEFIFFSLQLLLQEIMSLLLPRHPRALILPPRRKSTNGKKTFCSCLFEFSQFGSRICGVNSDDSWGGCRWESQGYFKPSFDQGGGSPFVIPMPPPNVTGSLHMGHAMFVTLEVVEWIIWHSFWVFSLMFLYFHLSYLAC